MMSRNLWRIGEKSPFPGLSVPRGVGSRTFIPRGEFLPQIVGLQSDSSMGAAVRLVSTEHIQPHPRAGLEQLGKSAGMFSGCASLAE